MINEPNRRRLIRLVTVVGVLLVVELGSSARVPAGAAKQPVQMPKLLVDSMHGKDLYTVYCSSCHGAGGRGDGPVAAALNTAPTDLTALARRAGGRFPFDRVLASVSGSDEVPLAHGTSEMPLWGPIFVQLDQNDTRARTRLENVVKYLEGLQRE